MTRLLPILILLCSLSARAEFPEPSGLFNITIHYVGWTNYPITNITLQFSSGGKFCELLYSTNSPTGPWKIYGCWPNHGQTNVLKWPITNSMACFFRLKSNTN